MMSIEAVRNFFTQYDRTQDIKEFAQSSATVELAAAALSTEPARIAKTLAFQKDDTGFLIVAAGDTKIDNKKFKQEFGIKAKMLTPEMTFCLTGHAIGGVCPFGLTHPLPVYLDLSMKRFTTVFPACGSSNSAIELTLEDLFQYSHAVKWVDVCKDILPAMPELS